MNWWNLFLLFILFAGHCELVVALENRLHAMRLRQRTLQTTGALLDVPMLGFPLVLLWFVGLSGPKLLLGGSWADLPLGWIVYLSLCGVGALSLVRSVIRYQRYHPPRPQLSNHTQRVDVVKLLGHRPMGNAKGGRLLRIPGNQQFQFDVTEKTFRLPRLPREWDGLTIGHLSDFHFRGTVGREYFERVTDFAAAMQPDLFVFTGDLLDDQRYVDWLPTTLGRLSAPLGCYFVLGNHDWYRQPDAIRRAFVEHGWIPLGGRTERREYRGRTLFLAGTEVPWMGSPPDLSTKPIDAFTLLLSHTPDTLPWAQEHGVDLMLAGHNHGGQIRLPIIGPIYTPSRFGCRYAAGTFWEPPTLLHVSRGVSGKQPIRLNCRPEITKIILRTHD